jgi:hypothetical protein
MYACMYVCMCRVKYILSCEFSSVGWDIAYIM